MQFVEQYKDQLIQWIELHNYKQIYNSLTDGYTTKSVNEHITGHEHVMLIIETTNGFVFGSYNGKRIPLKTEAKIIPTGYFVECDEDYFLFSLKNPTNKAPLLWNSHTHSKSLSIHPDQPRDHCIIGTVCGYWLYEDRAFISDWFHSNYQTLDGLLPDNKIFTGNCYPQTFQVKQLIGLEWF
ncbi:hypothetical protein EHI8A_229800 [Entamoeba histolytica HM-1:IMSS-B]|uniref:TLDc domain-containing protein n=7 Tax=Entamoeba TaxID=5758 RepID=C4M2Z6_ENTH1|nr:hypothetical protein EHI_074070 [Entamoeba histolytica HM-1:IMSS]EMD48116.1 Hypothetical protein EHI5A_039460 [Entamoeba histolytica KU27]EMH77347.1 hypothetical protein EHI8A_229800 [Entamoeba histolytica HM-1:IMSS-B]EMS14167.1 hypothetical protein KM1_053250 [Entamoeba histolytica HM-3:IMSS]ENY65464.1 hypothetical protein EHI7A_035980 [Entamoeba histolytica HM-1:IMSS-A]GAT95670.1 hypothetical protein CL6EHI_074070 [Entamoeba histolytica]|eukprot:XP_653545.1 hypothetical protein EHI_074070 [Entamoeba histolytica HM-1:IMSS]